ncbi:MAG TPA: ATP-binding cassette domain-containing protein [Planctomycetota bacterium]
MPTPERAGPPLELRGAGKSFGAQVALLPTDLVFEAGRTTVLIGPSGCGKSTLLRLLNGLLAPDSGEVLFRGAPLRAAALHEARRRSGYLIQEGGLFPHLTAGANVALPAQLADCTAAAIAARLRDLAGLARLPADLLDRYPAQLSGGQRQRVALMRALVLDPDTLLLDEPLGSLDPLVRAELQDDLRAIFRALGKTVVFVTHDLAEAAWFADRVVLLRAGRVVQAGTIAELARRPAEPFVREFLAAQRRTHAGLEALDA